MAPPSKLGVATSALMRLVKEEASYHKEMEQQEARIKKLESNTEDENAEYQLKQERQGLEETKNVLPNMRSKITQALQKLEEQLESNKEAGGEASTEDVTKAKEAIAKGKESLREIS
ncbi:tubulin binding cofactor A [Trematosphaeria pertusa]|uniref:Tubulin-specific chaperone A n=1 Tax=Trematosphaeria pertusa TaxID=390896 RepID=A0A6A6I3V8_9PLEO|nr:tubulin binding cofactor A [Trematosphaeria pertusa]KAF2244869.1 tubulin binding cofactor A [Trematosphaeria pertusa]